MRHLVGRLRRTPRLAGLLVAATLGIAGCGSGTTQFANSASRSGPAVVTIDRATHGPAIPSGFLGISMEFRGLEAYAGEEPKAVNPVFEQLLRNLAAGGTPVLRIGGDGTDWTWYPVAHMARPPGVKYDLDQRWLAVTRALTRAVNGRLILGVNLEADSTRVAAGEVHAFDTGLDRKSIIGFEIGNEPELYGSFPWYKAPDGQHVRGRPPGYGFTSFLGDFSRFARALPGVPLVGPSSGSPKFMAALGTFLKEEPRVALATVHKYPLKHCRATTRVTMSQLLSEQASGGLANSVAGLVSVARAHHVPLRIDEMNAVTCGGVRGVSDAFGSALWVLDTLFQMARVGVSGVNMHTVPNTINELIGTSLSGGHWVARVHPQYYGMMLFAQAAPAGARLLRVSGAAGALRVWATRASDGRVRVILINDDTGGARAVSLHIPAGNGGPAALERLEAPHAGSTSGVRLGGQSFGAQTSTGQLSGRPQLETVTPGRGGVYAVTLPAASAALLTLPAAG